MVEGAFAVGRRRNIDLLVEQTEKTLAELSGWVQMQTALKIDEKEEAETVKTKCLRPKRRELRAGAGRIGSTKASEFVRA